VDIKDMNPEIYLAYTGKENPLVLKNLEWILQHNDPERIKVRVPHIPEFNTDEDVAKSVERLKAMGVVDIDEFNYVIR
jgi:pyruvate formate lyase activating enzyme